MIEHVHSIALTIVGFDSTSPLDPHDLSRTTSPYSRLAVTFLALRLFVDGRNSRFGILPAMFRASLSFGQ